MTTRNFATDSVDPTNSVDPRDSVDPTNSANWTSDAACSNQDVRTGRHSDAVGTSFAMGNSDGQRDRKPGQRPSTAASSGSRVDPQSHAPFQDGGIETQRILTVFGSNTRRGYWEPPERLEVFSLFGGVTLDFSDANLYSGVTLVNCLAIFGGIDIIVSAELEVDANGTGLFGGFDLQALKKRKRGIFGRRQAEPPAELDYDPDDDPPSLRVRGFALFGGVTVKVR
jgi:hypothetical protein